MTALAESSVPWFAHLYEMTDEFGLFEHAHLDIPKRHHGYCLDDVARALVVTVREPEQTPLVDQLLGHYLTFTRKALDRATGAFHNRMNTRGEWQDEPSIGDWWGRGVWGLGMTAARATSAERREDAIDAFHVAAQQRSDHLMSMALATLGAAAVLTANPEDDIARALIQDFVALIGPIDVENPWPWPESRMRYDCGHVVEALLAAATVLERRDLFEQALGLLDFVIDQQTYEGHLSPIPVGGCRERKTLPAFDQQPIEVGALADACAHALQLTEDLRWLESLQHSWAWFDGFNDVCVRMYDPATGGGFDGLKVDGPNYNQGAESTIALISTAQHARRFGILP